MITSEIETHIKQTALFVPKCGALDRQKGYIQLNIIIMLKYTELKCTTVILLDVIEVHLLAPFFDDGAIHDGDDRNDT